MTPEQIAAFNAGQQCQEMHPLTCGNRERHADGLHTDGEGVLVADHYGAVCPYCGWRQPDMIEELRAAGMDAWDGVDDLEALLAEMRGEGPAS